MTNLCKEGNNCAVGGRRFVCECCDRLRFGPQLRRQVCHTCYHKFLKARENGKVFTLSEYIKKVRESNERRPSLQSTLVGGK